MKEFSLAEVLKLPVPERIRLIEAIWDSITEVPEALPLTDAQRAELDKRTDAYLKDPQAGLPWSEVRARILARCWPVRFFSDRKPRRTSRRVRAV